MIGIMALLTQKEAFTAIYQNTNGPNWSTQWNFSEPVCTFSGITCNRHDLVIEINLNSFNLQNTLPDVFDSFPYLKSLLLNNNSLTSFFPSTFCSLSNLQYFEANFAGFTGVLPTCFCENIHLQYVELEGNFMSGQLPACLAELTFLKGLNLKCNSFSGSITNFGENLQFVNFACNSGVECQNESEIDYFCGMENCECPVEVCQEFDDENCAM